MVVSLDPFQIPDSMKRLWKAESSRQLHGCRLAVLCQGHFRHPRSAPRRKVNLNIVQSRRAFCRPRYTPTSPPLRPLRSPTPNGTLNGLWRSSIYEQSCRPLQTEKSDQQWTGFNWLQLATKLFTCSCVSGCIPLLPTASSILVMNMSPHHELPREDPSLQNTSSLLESFNLLKEVVIYLHDVFLKVSLLSDTECTVRTSVQYQNTVCMFTPRTQCALLQ